MGIDHRSMRQSAVALALAGAGAVVGATTYIALEQPARAAAVEPATALEASCTPQAMTAVAGALGRGVIVKTVPNGPQLPGGVKYYPAAGKVPAFCQVTGSYVTNEKTGKTANFIATFPEAWNGKYLQLGCSGACGYLLMNDPNSPPITVTAQGYPGQLVEKGYAVFGNDLGHVLPGPTTANFDWLKTPDGKLDADSLADYLYRADYVMADMGKAFTGAFYGRERGSAATIGKSYFSGCSQGGREALVAATRFPEKFDGIIAGSPLSDSTGILWKGFGLTDFAQRFSPAKLTPAQLGMVNGRIMAQCDALDGVKDGLIQNPAACGFRASRDLKICASGAVGDDCVSQPQADAIGITLSGLTDERGAVLHPGYPVGELSWGTVGPAPAGVKADKDLRFIVGPAFEGVPLATSRSGGPGAVQEQQIVANGGAYARYFAAMRPGTPMPEDFGPLLKRNVKLLWYHNLSDEALTPYMSFGRYKRLAALHGGYAKLQTNIRFFPIPASGHCGLGGNGPSNFDAMGAIENWVERGVAPEALMARTLDLPNLLSGRVDWSTPAKRTMPLCAFPRMASYNGNGDVNDGRNWSCRPGDTRMLGMGEAGRQAGVSN